MKTVIPSCIYYHNEWSRWDVIAVECTLSFIQSNELFCMCHRRKARVGHLYDANRKKEKTMIIGNFLFSTTNMNCDCKFCDLISISIVCWSQLPLSNILLLPVFLDFRMHRLWLFRPSLYVSREIAFYQFDYTSLYSQKWCQRGVVALNWARSIIEFSKQNWSPFFQIEIDPYRFAFDVIHRPNDIQCGLENLFEISMRILLLNRWKGNRFNRPICESLL